MRDRTLLDQVAEALRVALGLPLDAAQRLALLLRLDRAESLPVAEQQVIDGPGLRRNLSDGDTPTSGQLDRAVVLDDPAGLDQHPIDLDPRPLLGMQALLHGRQGNGRGACSAAPAPLLKTA